MGNLPWSTTDADLQQIFAPYEPYDCHVKTNMAGRSRGFGIVRYVVGLVQSDCFILCVLIYFLLHFLSFCLLLLNVISPPFFVDFKVVFPRGFFS